MLLLWASSAQAQYWVTPEACAVSIADAETLAAIPREPTNPTPNAVGKFWRIQSPDGAVSHLWGTFHSNDPMMLRLPAPVMRQINSARVVALEMDPIFKSRRALDVRNEWRSYFRPPHQTSFNLTTALDPRVLDWMQSRAHGLGLGRDTVLSMSLGALAEVSLFDPCNDFAFGTLPIQDSYIQMLGLMAGADIQGLEKADDLITHLNKPEHQQLALDIITLYAAISGPKAPADARATAFALYQTGQIGAMQDWEKTTFAAILGDTFSAETIDNVDTYLVTQRNDTFLQTALPALQQGGVFTAIGCFHLPGQNGMIELLRRAGFTVTRVPLAQEIAS